MKTLPVGELKAQFSEVLEKVSQGESYGILYGKKKKPVAMIVPYKENQSRKARKIGLYNGKITIKIAEDFEISEQDLLNA
jgi:antitoxin (DNA-binding transcriptional repressor) of toxin-antitoxin stability system